MSKGYSGLFSGTMGTAYINGIPGSESYSDRGIDIPDNVRKYLLKLKKPGDYISGSADSFSMTDVSIMSKETGVEFAKITVDGKAYVIRGDVNGTVIPSFLLTKLTKHFGTLDFHSHPHDDDCIPSKSDRLLIRKLHQTTGQQDSIIVTPNGRITIFDEHGVKEVNIISNTLDEARKKALIELFGG